MRFVSLFEYLNNQHLKDLEASDVQDADERGALAFGPVQSLVDAMDEPAEQPLVCRLGQSFNSKVSLRKENKACRTMKSNYAR